MINPFNFFNDFFNQLGTAINFINSNITIGDNTFSVLSLFTFGGLIALIPILITFWVLR